MKHADPTPDIERAAQPYVALRRVVSLPFDDVVEAAMSRLWAVVAARGIDPAGPPFFKYNRMSAGEFEIEFGMPTATPVPPDDEVVTGTLPAGRYATLTYHGHYGGLFEVNAVLVDWLAKQGHAQDMQRTPQGDRFACRLEIYPNDPREVPNPDDWETMLAFKLMD